MKNIDNINCNECQFINLIEEEQIDKRIDHKCLKYNTRIIHKSSNPYIKCNGQDFIKREE